MDRGTGDNVVKVSTGKSYLWSHFEKKSSQLKAAILFREKNIKNQKLCILTDIDISSLVVLSGDTIYHSIFRTAVLGILFEILKWQNEIRLVKNITILTVLKRSTVLFSWRFLTSSSTFNWSTWRR